MPILKPLPHHIAYPSYVKFAAPELWTDRNRTIVAGACTDVVYLKMAVDKLSDEFEHLNQWTETSVRKAASETLTAVHKDMRAVFGTKDQFPQLFLMIGARLDNWKAILMTTSATGSDKGRK